MHIEETSHLLVGKTCRDVLTNVFFFALFTFACIWLAGRFNLVSKIGFFAFGIVFLFIAYNAVKTFCLTVVCVSNPSYSSTIKNRNIVAAALRIAETVAMYLLLSLLCGTLYGKSLIRFIKYTL